MAIIELHPFISSASGKLGGLVITTWKGICVLRGRGWPINPRTPLQQGNRKAFGETVKAWRNLSPETKAHWNNRACGRPLSGYNEFVAANMRRLRSGAPLLLDGPEESTEKVYQSNAMNT